MNTPTDIYQEYVLSQVNILFDLGVPQQSEEHAECFHKVINHLKELYKVAPDYFPKHHVERITRYKVRYEGGKGIQDFERASFLAALDLVKRTDYRELSQRCSKVEDVVSIVISQNHSNRQKQIGGSGSLIVSNRQVRRHRTPNCWQCKRGLNNYVDLECSACRWIVCTCGACGCDWAIEHPEAPAAKAILKVRETRFQTNSDLADCDDADVYGRDDEQELIQNELAEYNEDWSRSNDDGWFYSDDEKEN